MKIEVVISLSSLLLLFLSSPSSALVSLQPKPAVDVQGQPLLTGTQYHMVPVVHGRGNGSPTMAPPLSGTCPFDVAQEDSLSFGLPVMLTPGGASNQKGVAIHTLTNYNIKFTTSSPAHVNTCGAHSTTVWKVGSHLRPGTLVTTGGAKTNDFRAVFQLVEFLHPGYYALVSCGPSVCYGSSCTRDAVRCLPVGNNEDDGSHTRRLAISYSPFLFFFKKA